MAFFNPSLQPWQPPPGGGVPASSSTLVAGEGAAQHGAALSHLLYNLLDRPCSRRNLPPLPAQECAARAPPRRPLLLSSSHSLCLPPGAASHHASPLPVVQAGTANPNRRSARRCCASVWALRRSRRTPAAPLLPAPGGEGSCYPVGGRATSGQPPAPFAARWRRSHCRGCSGPAR